MPESSLQEVGRGTYKVKNITSQIEKKTLL